MNYIEALASGKPYKRATWGDSFRPAVSTTVTCTELSADLLANDWETQPREFTLIFWSDGAITKEGDANFKEYKGKTPPTVVERMRVREVAK